jgi:hypothetical protein
MALDGIRKLCSTTTCSGGVISILHSPWGSHAGERGVEEGNNQGEEGGGQVEEEGIQGSWNCVCSLQLVDGAKLTWEQTVLVRGK